MQALIALDNSGNDVNADVAHSRFYNLAANPEIATPQVHYRTHAVLAYEVPNESQILALGSWIRTGPRWAATPSLPRVNFRKRLFQLQVTVVLANAGQLIGPPLFGQLVSRYGWGATGAGMALIGWNRLGYIRA